MERVLRRSKSFRLGYCTCGKEIAIRNKSKCTLIRFAHGHGSHNKSGRVFDGHGYILRWKAGDYIREHRLVWEEHHNACLLSWSDVHHIDGNKRNNVWYNLKAMTKSNHTTEHQTKDMTHRFCSVCKSNTTYTDKHGWRQWYGDENKWICSRCNNRKKTEDYGFWKRRWNWLFYGRTQGINQFMKFC